MKRGRNPAYYDPPYPFEDIMNKKKGDPLQEALKNAANEAALPKTITMSEYKAGLKAKTDLADRILNGNKPTKIWQKPSKYTQLLARHAYNMKQREVAIKTLGDTKMADENVAPAGPSAYRFIQKKRHHRV